ncbi:STAS domain-containing protein [Thalassoglobus sp. JC818]|uniref:STAS domain-containing protein n=1 Tax=Thalassoglobus sp. JC818 TaxID=3232136 RepID=UPI0034595CD4
MKTEVTMDDVRDHSILSCSARGNTLIVKPTGSIVGFEPRTFHNELHRIKTLMSSGEFRNLIFDLSGARYFGTELISAIVSLGKMVNESGQALVAEPSPDMRLVLEKMKVNLIVPIEDSTQQAISRVVEESPNDWLKRNKFLAIPMVVAVAIFGVFALTASTNLLNGVVGTQASRQYYVLTEQISEIEKIRSEENPSRAWTKFSARADGKLKPFLDTLRDQPARSPLNESLYQSTLAVWQLTVQDVVPSETSLESAKSKLAETARLISAEQGLTVAEVHSDDQNVNSQKSTLPADQRPVASE